MIHLFQVKRAVADQPAEDVTGSWQVCSPETVKGFSAVQYFFARHLLGNLHVPMGMIESDWGGTPAQAWTSKEALAADPALAEGVRESVRASLAGVVPRAAWPWAPLALLAALWALVLAAGRLAPSRRCEKCGRPACGRCDPSGGSLCGQCLNVYVRKGAVEPRFRQRKEAQVRRRRTLISWGSRALAVLTGGGGYVAQGAAGRGLAVFTALLFLAFLLLFRDGALPPNFPSPWATWAKLVVALPVAALVYLVAVRDQLRRVRG
jgi:hypothetical protein